MRKFIFWLPVLFATFALGLGAFFVYYLNQAAEIAEPAPVQEEFDCTKPKDFPGRSRSISELTWGKNDYFPKGAFGDGWENGDGTNEWYGQYLRAMKEVSFRNTTDENHEAYRFLWLRSFHHPVAVRIERDGRGPFRVVSEELTGSGYEPEKILRTDNITISKEQWCEFINLVVQASFWSEEEMGHYRGGRDGAEWVLEGVKTNRYHVVNRWSPENGKFREACIYLLKLSGRDIDKLGRELY